MSDFEYYGEGMETQTPLHTGFSNTRESKDMKTADDLAKLQRLQRQKLTRDVANLTSHGAGQSAEKAFDDLASSMNLG